MNLYSSKEKEDLEFKDEGLKSKFFFVDPLFVDYFRGLDLNKFFSLKHKRSTIDSFLGKLLRKQPRTGKKQKLFLFLKKAFENLRSRKYNPLQLFVSSIENCAPKEGYTMILIRGSTLSKSVDYSPSKRLDLALSLLAKAIIKETFNSKKKIVSILENMLLSAGKNEPKNSAILKKNEIENIAKASR